MTKDEEKASPIGNFLSRLGRVRSKNSDKTSNKEKPPGKENDSFVFKCPATPPRSHSPSSRFGTLVNRLSGRKAKKVNCRDMSGDREDSSSEKPHHVSFASPRPAVSENDLRHVTLSRGGCELPVTPLAGVAHFMSEDNLASTECGTPARRVPSYVKISCTLNGYSKSPRQQPQVIESPLRSTKGMSIVERRLMQYRDFNSSTCTTPSPQRLPLNSEGSPDMGNNISSTTPIKSLISQFDKLHLCTREKQSGDGNGDAPEKPTHIITEQPDFNRGETMSDKENLSDLSKYIGEAIPSTSSSDLDSEENSPRESSVSEEPNIKINEDENKKISSARSGNVFLEVLNNTKNSLEERIQQGDHELESVADLPDEAASSIRMACGKAKLLIRKKLSKFSELVNKNLNPVADDPQPATEDDLEGYWALVEIELDDINQCFQEVERWRKNGWKEVEPDKNSEENLSNNNNVVKPKPTTVRPKLASAPPKAKTEKQLAMEQLRKKQMAEARARMAAARKAEKEDSESNIILAS